MILHRGFLHIPLSQPPRSDGWRPVSRTCHTGNPAFRGPGGGPTSEPASREHAGEKIHATAALSGSNDPGETTSRAHTPSSSAAPSTVTNTGAPGNFSGCVEQTAN